MPTLAITDFRLLRASGPLLGLDLGDRTIGVAACDPAWMVAMPVETIRRTKLAADIARLAELIRQRGARGLVIGLPVSLNGTEGSRCQSVRAFARNLDKAGLALPILFQDERMSTAAVERSLVGDLDMRRDKRAAVIDAHAAAYILQGALDAMAYLAPARGG